MSRAPRWAALAALVTGCSPLVSTPPADTAAHAPAQWSEAHARLEQLRAIWKSPEGTTPVIARFTGGDGAEVVEGRGALAVRKPDAVRMIVVTAGGPTAFDLWIRDDRFRMAMPLRDRIVRGREGEGGAGNTDLPVGFLRWWLLTPLQGKLIAAYEEGAGPRWVLQHERATYDVRAGDGALTIVRRGAGATELLEVQEPSCPRAVYRNVRLGVEVVIACDPSGERTSGAAERAFEDPDATRR